MKSTKIKPQNNHFHDEPSNVKLQHVIEGKQIDINHLHQVEYQIFEFLQVQYKLNEIPINNEEYLHTIFVETSKKQNKNRNFYLTHGFGGSSLMYFPILNYLLNQGNVILWQIRGMGFSKKLDKYHITLQQSQQFFVKPIDKMLRFYRHKQIFFISHSFGGYLTLLYILKYKSFIRNIKEVILLSPVGITPKQQDYKYKIKSLSDCIHTVGNLISWKFHLTYKSPFRCICSCLKNRVFKGAVQNCGFKQMEQKFMKNLLISMIQETDGSQNIFFNYFQPRVLPKFPIQPIFKETPPQGVKIKILFGGQEDWVDKKGAQHLQKQFPQKISIKLVKQCGHNFPFFPEQLTKCLQEILFHHKPNGQSILTEIKQSDCQINKRNEKTQSILQEKDQNNSDESFNKKNK